MKRFLVTTGLVILALILLIAGFVTVIATTSWGQGFVTQQVNSYLGKKIKAPFRIGRISYHIPDWIELDDVFFKTPQGDTLLIGKRMRVDLDMMALMQSKISLNQVELDDVRLHVTRTLPDTAFNFNYILDAFNTAQPDTASLATKIAPPADTTSTPLDISLSGATLRKVLIRYEDDVAGANVNAYVDSLRLNFDEVNVARSRYLIRDVSAVGLTVKSRIYEGIPTPSTPSKPGDTLTLGLGKWQLDQARWDVRVETADFATTGKVGKLAMESDYFHLNGEKVGIRSLAMANSDITTTLLRPQRTQQAARTPEAAVAIKQADPTVKAAAKAEQKAEAAQPSGWIARVGLAKFSNNRIRFDDETQARQPRGLDYGHLDLSGLGIEGRNLLYSPDKISGQIRQGKFRDKSGFVLQHFDVDLLYGEKATLLTNLFIRTPGTILRDRLELRYDSLGQLTRATEGKNLNRVSVLLNLRQSKLAFADVLQLAPFLADTPPLAGNRNEVVRADAQLRGTLADLRIPKAEFAMFSGTVLKASGRLTNVTNPDRLGLDLTLTDARTNRADIGKFVPPGTLPDSLALAPQLKLTGKIRGTLNKLVTDAKLATNWGTAAFDGTLRNFYAGKGQSYAGKAVLTNFEAGKWLMNPKQFGTITARAAVNGSGIDPATMETNFRAVVDEAGLNGYSYKNADVTGSLVNGLLTLKGGINDPNVRLNLDTKVSLKTTYPTIAGDINIQELNLDKLKLYADPLSIKGNIKLAMTSTGPVRPEGTIYASDAVVSLKGKTYPIDTLYLKAGTVNPGRKTLTLGLPFGQLALSGQFEYTQLYDIVASEIGRYFKIPDLTYKTVQPPYSFYVTGQVRQHPLLQAFVPALRKLDPVSLDAYLDNTRDTTFAATIKTGLVDYDTIVVKGSSLGLLAYNNQLSVAGQVNALQTNSLKIGLTQLSGSAANNRFSFSVVNKDSLNKDRYGLAGLVSLVGSDYRLQVGQRGLLTNYRTWTSDTTGYIQYGKAGVLAQNFLLRQGAQTITVNSVNPVPNGPLRVEARNVSLSDLSSLANQDTTLVAGTLNSTVVVRDYLSPPGGTPLSFTGDLNVDSLRVMDKPIGNLNGDFANASGGRIGVNVTLLSSTNDAKVSGYYDPTNPKESLDFYLKLNKLDAKTIEAFSFGELRRAKGMLRGETDIQGTPDNPRLNGGISFDSVAFNIKQLNATYRIDQERIRLEGQTMTFTDFNLRDTLGRTLTTDGKVVLSNIPDVSYDLRVRAQNFLALNAARKDNDFFYGKAAISANMHIVGKGGSPAVTGSVKLEEGSKVTTVLPSDEASLNDARQVVTFINHNDTLALSKYLRPRKDTVLAPLQFEQLNNSNINLTLEATDKSEITIIVDELNGDNLKARGNANLAVNVSPSGEISVLGRYEVTEGRYSLTYQVLQREFELQKGGYINFTGDPLKADLNLTAIYEARTTSDALIASETSNSTQATTKVNLPYNVALTLSGNLASPTIGFDIIAPSETLTRLGSSADLVTQKLATLREDPNQMNKQVFGLLILGNFISETSGGSSSEFNVGNTAESLARSSVSKIISQQLQQFASGLIKGVDLDVGLNSRSGTAETGDTTSNSSSRTDLNIGLSRSFMQGRLTVSVGKNFVVAGASSAQNNAVFDNLNLNYNLTRDGRYALRAYRRSNTERTILEGFVIETGVGFVITVDFNTLAELVRRRKDEEQE
ncbi:translocation/assembly module TamB domain-containing protein [uncultured Fibrella sp.]|uniref:translocation/assembly module TamB domain-containing protein n=1 Tax=uncultured Fibrella sp. TaxID=1284596 RepID=UPI0035CBC058